MRGVVALLLLWSGPALAEQPRGTYTLDRGEWTEATDGEGNRIPSCGGEKIFGGQATFVVDYDEKIVINGREWRFKGYTILPRETKPRPDALVVAMDPESNDSIEIWFGMNRNNGRAGGLVHVRGVRGKKRCADAWHLIGKHTRT